MFFSRLSLGPCPVHIFSHLLRRKFVFAYAALRACPILRKILESGSSFDTIIRITNCGIVDISTCVTDVLFHRTPPNEIPRLPPE